MEHYGRRIRVFKNGDPYFTGKKMLISPTYHRLYEQLLLECSRHLQLKVKNIYTITGEKLKGLEDFVDGSCYVCTAGEPFKRVNYNDSETGPNFNAYSKTNLNIPVVNDNPILERKKINRSTGGLLSEEDASLRGSEASLFVATSKAFKIAVFENGEPKQDGMRLILNHRNCKTFDQLMKYFSSLKIIKSGQVRKMYDAKNGKRVRHLSDIENGMNLVLSAFDPFKKVPYRVLDLTAPTNQIKKEPDVLRIVKFFPNGDAYHSGLTVTLTKRRHSTMTKLLDQLNSQIELVTGKIQKIYTTDGSRCNIMDDMKAGGNYVLVANDDPFIKTQYNKMALKPSTNNRGLQGHTLRNDFIKRIRPITQRRLRRQTVNENAAVDETTVDAPAKLKSTRSSKKEIKLEDDGVETERKDPPAPSRKLASRGKTPPAKPQTPKAAPAKEKSVAALAPAPAPETEQEEEEEVEEEIEEPEVATVSATQLIREVATKPKTPVEKKALAPVNGEKSKPDLSQNADGPEKVKFKTNASSRSSAVNKSKPSSPEPAEDVSEDEKIVNSTGREEEELFESEKQKLKILSATKMNDGPSASSKPGSKPASKPASRVHTAPNGNLLMSKDELASFERTNSQPDTSALPPKTPPKKYTSTSNNKSSKSISKIPKAVSSRSSSQTNLKSDGAQAAEPVV